MAAIFLVTASLVTGPQGVFLLVFDVDLHLLLGADEGSGNVILHNIGVVGI
jgi:hypothetical protein